jgi:hypothetical protein
VLRISAIFLSVLLENLLPQNTLGKGKNQSPESSKLHTAKEENRRWAITDNVTSATNLGDKNHERRNGVGREESTRQKSGAADLIETFS